MESVLGIEFNHASIKILEVSLKAEGLEPSCLAQIDLPAKSIKEGIIVEPRLIAEKISEFIKKNNLSTKKAIAVVNPPYVFTRISRLPHNLTDEQIRLNLEAELNQYQALSGKNIVIDFKKLEEIAEEGIKKVNVLFTATLRALSESYLKCLESAGIDLISIDVPMLSLLRLLDEVDLKSSSLEVSMLLSIHQNYLEMCVLKGNRPRFLHSVEFETSNFEQDKEGFVERLVSAIKLVVNFYQARFMQGEQISRIIINPLDNKYAQISTLLQEKLPYIPIRLCNPLGKVSFKQESDIDPTELKFAFSSILGAVLRLQNKLQPFDLNLLLEQRQKREYRFIQVFLSFLMLSCVLGAVIISLFWIIFKINFLQSRVGNYMKQLEKPPVQLNRTISLKSKKELLQKRINEASWIIGNLPKPFYFKNIAKAMVLVPPELWLTEIAFDDEKKDLVLNGEARTEKAIFSYNSRLSESGYFTAVELISSQGSTEGIKFIIKCAIK